MGTFVQIEKCDPLTLRTHRQVLTKHHEPFPHLISVQATRTCSSNSFPARDSLTSRVTPKLGGGGTGWGLLLLPALEHGGPR